ncbi:MAG TPA: hypothetical protein VFB80_03815, partial [Pirellulaceae bacterium]|nr:hypothetical protein [Pirellulaceae bacterium]
MANSSWAFQRRWAAAVCTASILGGLCAANAEDAPPAESPPQTIINQYAPQKVSAPASLKPVGVEPAKAADTLEQLAPVITAPQKTTPQDSATASDLPPVVTARSLPKSVLAPIVSAGVTSKLPPIVSTGDLPKHDNESPASESLPPIVNAGARPKSAPQEPAAESKLPAIVTARELPKGKPQVSIHSEAAPPVARVKATPAQGRVASADFSQQPP